MLKKISAAIKSNISIPDFHWSITFNCHLLIAILSFFLPLFNWIPNRHILRFITVFFLHLFWCCCCNKQSQFTCVLTFFKLNCNVDTDISIFEECIDTKRRRKKQMLQENAAEVENRTSQQNFICVIHISIENCYVVVVFWHFFLSFLFCWCTGHSYIWPIKMYFMCLE